MHVFACTSDVCMEAVDFSSVEMYDMVCMYIHPYACRHVCVYVCLYVFTCVLIEVLALILHCVRMWLVLRMCM